MSINLAFNASSHVVLIVQAVRGSEQRGHCSLLAGSSRGAGSGSGPGSADRGLPRHCASMPEDHWCSLATTPSQHLSRCCLRCRHNLRMCMRRTLRVNSLPCRLQNFRISQDIAVFDETLMMHPDRCNSMGFTGPIAFSKIRGRLCNWKHTTAVNIKQKTYCKIPSRSILWHVACCLRAVVVKL